MWDPRILPRWHSAALAVCLVACLVITFQVGVAGRPLPVDHALLMLLRTGDDAPKPIGPSWVLPRVRDITALGSGTTLTLLTVISVAVLWLKGRRREGVVAAAVIAVGAITNATLKILLGRARPLPWDGSMATLDSFPSGHAMMSMVTYLTLMALWWRFESSRAVRSFAFGLALVVVLVVGLTRVYLAVHWASDVIAGWLFGVTWLLLCRWLVQVQARRTSM